MSQSMGPRSNGGDGGAASASTPSGTLMRDAYSSQAFPTRCPDAASGAGGSCSSPHVPHGSAAPVNNGHTATMTRDPSSIVVLYC